MSNHQVFAKDETQITIIDKEHGILTSSELITKSNAAQLIIQNVLDSLNHRQHTNNN